MALNKNLYTSSTSVLDANIIYDQNKTKTQQTINSEQATINSEQATINSEQATTNSEQATTNRNTKTSIVKLGGGNALFIGDSYCTKSTGYDNALPEILKDIMGFDTIYNYSVAGAGYVNGSGTNQNFPGQLNSAVSDLTADQKANISYVFILGGQNDYAHTISNLVSAVTTALDTAKENFPNAQIVVLPLWYNRAVSDASSQRFAVIYYYANLKGCITDSSSWAYMINTLTTMMDNVHPSQTSLNYMGGCIANAIRGNKAVLENATGVVRKSTNLGISFNYTPTATFDGECVHFRALFTSGTGGVAANSTVFQVDPIFIPAVSPYIYGHQYGGYPIQFVINPTTGAVTNNPAIAGSKTVFIDATWHLFGSEMTVIG